MNNQLSSRRLIATVLAPVFISLARIDEDNRSGTRGLKLSITPDLMKKLFPRLYANKAISDYLYSKQLTVSLTQLSSAFMLMSLFSNKLLPDDLDFVELLGFSNVFYNTDTLEILKSEKRELVKFITLIHGLTMLPHYLEHCRGAFSEGIYKNFAVYSLDRSRFTLDDKIELIYYTIKNILKTGEYKSWKGASINGLNRKRVRNCGQEGNEQADLFKECCKNFGGRRYDSDLFFTLSKDFWKIWEILEIEKELTILMK